MASGSGSSIVERVKRALGYRPEYVVALERKVRELMLYSDREPSTVSDDEYKFTSLMSAFTEYEMQAKPDGNHSYMVDVLHKLKQHYNDGFPKDIPLYLILCYRFHIMHSYYDCDELAVFITSCINKLETMEVKKVASTISTFLERDDFKISCLSTDGKEFNPSIYFILESACIELARISYQIQRKLADIQKIQGHQGGQKPFCQNFVYSRMLWASLTLRIHDRCTASMTRSTTNLWQENLLKHSSRVILDLNTIREVKKGLELGRLLKLSAEASFNYLCMADLVTAGKTVRPLSHIKLYFHAVESYISFEADLADFLANIRAKYNLWLHDGKLATASAVGTVLATIKEGIGFVDCINEVCTRRKVDATLVESENIKWVLLLLHLVDFTDDEAQAYLKQFFMSHVTSSGLTGVRSILELFQYSTHIHNIQAVCDQYKLKGCLADPKLETLKMLVGDLRAEEVSAKLTPNETSKKLKKVKATLGITEKTNSKCLDLFAAIRDSAVFYQFVRDKQFYGESGNALFYQQYQLITAQLQYEEYDEQVLNHLFAAFKLMAPFMDPRQDLGTLMSKVLTLDVTNGLRKLDTVNANITLIRLWFSRAEGDTLQNFTKELDSIIQTGFYIFTLSRDLSGGLSAQIMLEYKPSTATPQPQALTSSGHHHSSNSSSDQGPLSFEVEGGAADNVPRTFPRMLSKMESQGGNDLYGTGTAGMKLINFERWNTEQIGDFVRKLGFLDKEKDKEGGDKIIHFLHINEVAYKLLELYIKLRELGHIQYINEGNTGPALSCQINPEDAEERVKETEIILTTWTHEVANLRKEFSWLLFFSVPKLLRLYRLLSEEQENVDVHLKRIVHEISFLCVNNAETRKRMNAKVQRAHEFCKKTMEENDVPVKIVGAFLNSLFEDHTLPHRCRPSSPLLCPRSVTRSLSLVQEFIQQLHFCPGYTQDGLIRVIVGLYHGVPESFEVFHCRSNTTEEELNLFLKRAAKFPLQYLILEVNKLPYKLQEHLMQLRLLVQQEFQGRQRHLSLRRNPSMDESVDISSPTAPIIHFVETAPSVLREMPWIQLREHKEPKLSFEDARKICVKTIVNSADFACIQLVYGFAGDGKTHYIKSQLEQLDESIIIAVNEAFTPLKAISKLRSLPLEKKDCGIFFNFTMLPPGDMVDEKERERYRQLMEVIGWFFFDIFILGYVEDPNTGKSFRMPGGLKWAVYIEVPSREHDMSPGEALKQFCCEVPVLGLIGTQHMIPRDKPYSVNEDVQLVCKYLRALSIGGTKGIDKLYREGQQLVKFSQEADLTAEECQSLLQKYMSEHVKKTKITQRLFIKYMKRRCMFLDTLPGFNYNTGSGEYIVDDQGQRRANDTRQLGSTLMKTMLNEVKDFCDPDIKENWSHKQHQQLIYDFKDGGGSLGLISLHPDKLPDEDKRQFMRIGVEMPSMM